MKIRSYDTLGNIAVVNFPKLMNKTEKKKFAEIEYYSYSTEKRDYATKTIQTINLENYTSELPASLKIAYLSGNRKKDVVFILHDRFYIITRN